MANACSTHGKARILAKHSEFETYDGFSTNWPSFLLSTNYSTGKFELWHNHILFRYLRETFIQYLQASILHSIDDESVDEALHTAYWTLFISCFYPSPVSVVEKSRINPLPDIPERTFSIEDPPEEKKGYFMIYKEWDTQFYLKNWMIGMVVNSLLTLLRSAGWADLG